MFIDSHCHLFYEDYKEDLPAVLKRAEDAGVQRFIVPATNHETARRAVDLAEQYDSIYACVGFHPLDLEHYSEENLASVEQLLSHPKVVAVGEIGIDYFYDTSPRDFQREIFAMQIDIAAKHGLPIVVHTRDSVQDAVDIVVAAVHKHPQWRDKGKRGVFHCFTGSADQATTLFDHRFLVSYPGPITFKKNDVMAQTLGEIGIENIMVETDSPYLTPVPYRGKRNEPSYIPLIARKISEILSIPVEEVEKKTTENVYSLFLLR